MFSYSGIIATHSVLNREVPSFQWLIATYAQERPLGKRIGYGGVLSLGGVLIEGILLYRFYFQSLYTVSQDTLIQD